MSTKKVVAHGVMFNIDEDAVDGTPYMLDVLEEDEPELVAQYADDDKDTEEGLVLVLEDEDDFELPEAYRAILGQGEDQPEEMEEAHETDWINDKDTGKALEHVWQMLNGIPQHSGQTTVGCEKAIAHLRRADAELSRAIQADEKDLINESEAEKIRDIIYDWRDKLEAAKEKLMGSKYKKNKKNAFRVGKNVVARINDGQNIQYFVTVANGNEETLLKVSLLEPTDEQTVAFIQGESFTKQAGAGISLFEDPFLHSITRLLIQSHITNGRDMQEVYATLRDKYSFTPREELSIQELLHQKGFPLIKDLGRVGEDCIKPFDGKGIEHDTEYYA